MTFYLTDTISIISNFPTVMRVYFKKARKGFRPMSASQNFLWIFCEFFQNFWEFFGNSLGIFWEFWGNSLRILWEFFWKFFGNFLGNLWECSVGGFWFVGNSLGILNCKWWLKVVNVTWIDAIFDWRTYKTQGQQIKSLEAILRDRA